MHEKKQSKAKSKLALIVTLLLATVAIVHAATLYIQ
jgi:hypothetical protein